MNWSAEADVRLYSPESQIEKFQDQGYDAIGVVADMKQGIVRIKSLADYVEQASDIQLISEIRRKSHTGLFLSRTFSQSG